MAVVSWSQCAARSRPWKPAVPMKVPPAKAGESVTPDRVRPMAPASPFPVRRRWASTGPATRNDTGACSAAGPAGSPTASRRRPSTWPSSGSPRPHSARYGSRDADAATIDSAAAASIRAASALAPARRPMPSAVAPGTPASSACPSRGPRLNSGRPRSRSAAAAGGYRHRGRATGRSRTAGRTRVPAARSRPRTRHRCGARPAPVPRRGCRPAAGTARRTPRRPRTGTCAAGRRPAPVRRPRPATAAPRSPWPAAGCAGARAAAPA